MFQRETVVRALIETLEKIQNNPNFTDFVLAGGTALTLHIGHRKSEDIDLFTQAKMNPDRMITLLSKIFSTDIKVIQNEQYVLQVKINNVEVDFVSMPFKNIENPMVQEGIKIYGLRDISAMKLHEIQNRRFKAKDYIDISYLLQKIPLSQMFEDYKTKYRTSDITDVKKALTESARVNPYEWETVKMIKNEIFVSDVPRILSNEVLKYNSENKIAKNVFKILKDKFIGSKG
jgi:hypothetical protein